MARAWRRACCAWPRTAVAGFVVGRVDASLGTVVHIGAISPLCDDLLAVGYWDGVVSVANYFDCGEQAVAGGG